MGNMEFKVPKGVNFRADEFISLEELSYCLCEVASFIQEDEPYADLLLYEDWWEHDGHHFFKKEADIHDLFEIAKTPRAIYEAMQGDDNVRIGVTTKDFKWYLRIYACWDEEDNKLEGVFDITLSEETTEGFRKTVLPKISCELVEESSEEYYRRIRL